MSSDKCTSVFLKRDGKVGMLSINSSQILLPQTKLLFTTLFTSDNKVYCSPGRVDCTATAVWNLTSWCLGHLCEVKTSVKAFYRPSKSLKVLLGNIIFICKWKQAGINYCDMHVHFTTSQEVTEPRREWSQFFQIVLQGISFLWYLQEWFQDLAE